MRLYGYIASKDELLDLMVDAVHALGDVDLDATMPVVAAVNAYVIGGVRREVAEWTTGMDEKRWQASLGPYLTRTFATGQFPRWPRWCATLPTWTPTRPSGSARYI